MSILGLKIHLWIKPQGYMRECVLEKGRTEMSHARFFTDCRFEELYLVIDRQLYFILQFFSERVSIVAE